MAKSQRSAARRAVETANAILSRESVTKAENPKDVAAARACLAGFAEGVAARSKEIETLNRQLKNILGITGAHYKITATTPPRDPKLSPVPDEKVFRASLGSDSPESRRRWRLYLTLDSNAKLVGASEQMTRAAESRLKAQEAFYGSKKVSLERYFDAIRNAENAACKEAEYRCLYSTSLAAMAEADGTLLDRHQIVVDSPAAGTVDTQARHAGFEPTNEGFRSFLFTIRFSPNVTMEIRSATTNSGETPDETMCVPPVPR